MVPNEAKLSHEDNRSNMRALQHRIIVFQVYRLGPNYANDLMYIVIKNNKIIAIHKMWHSYSYCNCSSHGHDFKHNGLLSSAAQKIDRYKIVVFQLTIGNYLQLTIAGDFKELS